MKDSFDSYVDSYSLVIAEGARASGETYEYMVALRTALFKQATVELLGNIDAPHILDFGCGTGYTLELLSCDFPQAVLAGFDSSRDSIMHAQQRTIPNTTFIHAENVPLPFEDNSFDAIYSNGTYHHITDHCRSGWTRELARVLKRNGVLVVFENNPLNPLMMQAMRRTPFDRDAEPIRSGRLSLLCKQAGLHPDSAHYYFFFPRALRWFRFFEPLMCRIPFGAQYYLMSRKILC